jgi:hypothetical protein
MPKLPKKPPSQNTIRFVLGALLTAQHFGKILLSGRKEPRMCPRCAYKLVEPAGRRWAGRGKPWVHFWRCGGCRALYESEGAEGPFTTPNKRMA